jgi:wyosine [tRNA(Phe)-imidazoG37] synthetase (radical SAM superfamily)
MAKKGLRSVIVIGGGEPTVYPQFVETILFMKDLGLQVSIVSNGSGMKRIGEVADRLEEEDWVRLSLDSSSDEVFQAMHKPKRKITLDEICEGVREVKSKPTRFKLGFSFIITWKGAFINDTNIVENLHEIVPGAERARKYLFDYISFKPFLTRAPDNNAEIVDLKESKHRNFDEVLARIRKEVDEAKKLETDRFKVYEATNLKVLENRSHQSYARQPHRCHMQFFRQVLSPLGTYNCPVYRNQPHGRVGSKESYADPASYGEVRSSTAELIRHFDATAQCKEVTCLYNHVNWWLEGLIEDPSKLDAVEAQAMAVADYFL